MRYAVKQAIKELVESSDNLEEAHHNFEVYLSGRPDFETLADLARATFQEHIEATERQIAKAKMYADVLNHLKSAILIYNAYNDKTWALTDDISIPRHAAWMPTDQMVQDAANTMRLLQFHKTHEIWFMPFAEYVDMDWSEPESESEQEWRIGIDEAGNFYDEQQGIGLEYMPGNY